MNDQNFIENNLQLNDLADKLVIIPMSILDIIIHSNNKNRSDAISLYIFYYYTAKWQKTNQARAVDSYCKKCIKIGSTRLKEAQKLLLDLGLIQRIVKKDNKGIINGWYIKINYIFKKQTIDKIIWENINIESSQTPSSVYYEFEVLKKNGLGTKIFERDNYICKYCNSKVIELNKVYNNNLKNTWEKINNENIKIATIDHIFPLSKGGTNKLDNLITSCHICNSIKSNSIHLIENEVVDKSINGLNNINALSVNNINALSVNNEYKELDNVQSKSKKCPVERERELNKEIDIDKEKDNNIYMQYLDYFYQKYNSFYGVKYKYSGKDGKQLKEIITLTSSNIEDFKQIVDNGFNEKFWTDKGLTIGILLSQINKLQIKKQSNPNAKVTKWEYDNA